VGSWLNTRICTTFGVGIPIVQTGMGWVSNSTLTAATANAGALGILSAATLSTDEMRREIAKTERLTPHPFGVNLRPDQPDMKERIRIVSDSGVHLVSFAGGPTGEIISMLRDFGVRSMVTVGRPRHAEKMLAAGVDALIAQGAEGGGHTGDVPTSLLVPAVVDVVAGGIPVLAAGGFRDGRGLAAAIAWGADGIAMGTRFMMTQESPVPAHVKQMYLEAGLNDTIVSDSFDGRPLRVLHTAAVDALIGESRTKRLLSARRNIAGIRRQTGQTWFQLAREGLSMRRAERLTLTQAAYAADSAALSRVALVEGDISQGLMPTGVVCGAITDLPSVADLISRCVAEAEDAIRRLAPPE